MKASNREILKWAWENDRVSMYALAAQMVFLAVSMAYIINDDWTKATFFLVMSYGVNK